MFEVDRAVLTAAVAVSMRLEHVAALGEALSDWAALDAALGTTP